MLRNSNYLYSPDQNLVPAKLNLADYLIKCFKNHGDEIALINGVNDERLTYKDILQESMNIAISLAQLGVRKGDFVGICSETRLEIWPTIVGIVSTGAVMTPFSTGYVKDELKHVMNISKPRYLFCSKQSYEVHATVFKSVDYIERIIIFEDGGFDDTLLYKDLANVSTNSVLKKNVRYEEFEVVDVDGQKDTAFLLYSSGTTGLPKGVMQSHLNTISTCTLSVFGDPGMTVLNVTPWFHALGLMSTLLYLSHGSTAVFLPKFEMDLYLKSMERYKANLLVVVPPVVMALTKTSIQYDVSSVVAMVCAAAALREKTIEAAKEKFKNLKGICQGYGLTETTFMVTVDTLFREGKCKPGSVGKVVSDTVIKIADVETRESLGPSQQGEVCIKGPMVLRGYLGKNNNDYLDKEGFLRTGDIGYYDEEEYLYIVDRFKELIKYKGYQVPPAEIEAVLLQHPGVRDVGVVGLPDAVAGEVPLAFVVPQPGANVVEGELQQFVAARLSRPKHIRGGVLFVDEIPRTASGKVLRRYLRDLAAEMKNGDSVELSEHS